MAPHRKRIQHGSNKETYKIMQPPKDNLRYYIGDLELGTTNNVIPSNWTTCEVTFPDQLTHILINFDELVVLISINSQDQYLYFLMGKFYFLRTLSI